MLSLQGGACAICRREVERLCIDHEHVRGWKRMPPEQRRLYVRCLACTYCNRRRIGRGMDHRIAEAIVEMFLAYEARRS
jgi:hypothetical protein